jgi:hypothetical protein
MKPGKRSVIIINSGFSYNKLNNFLITFVHDSQSKNINVHFRLVFTRQFYVKQHCCRQGKCTSLVYESSFCKYSNVLKLNKLIKPIEAFQLMINATIHEKNTNETSTVMSSWHNGNKRPLIITRKCLMICWLDRGLTVKFAIKFFVFVACHIWHATFI